MRQKSLIEADCSRGRGRPRNTPVARDGRFSRRIASLIEDKQCKDLSKRQIEYLDNIFQARLASVRAGLNDADLEARRMATISPQLGYENWEEVNMPSLNATIYVDTPTHIDETLVKGERYGWLASKDTSSTVKFATAIGVSRTFIRRHPKNGLIYFIITKRQREKAIANGAISVSRSVFRQKIEGHALNRMENARSERPEVETAISSGNICPYCLHMYRDHHAHGVVKDAVILCDFRVVSTEV